jgi:hypothetical protein
MPTEKRRIAFTLREPGPLNVLGLDPDLEEGQCGAIQVWAALWRLAAVIEEGAATVEKKLDRADWNLLADVMNGTADLFDHAERPVGSTAGGILANVEDGHALDGVGHKWYPEGQANARVRQLARVLKGCSRAEAEAIHAALRWSWTHTGPEHPIDHHADDWWTVAFRTGRRRAGLLP